MATKRELVTKYLDLCGDAKTSRLTLEQYQAYDRKLMRMKKDKLEQMVANAQHEADLVASEKAYEDKLAAEMADQQDNSPSMSTMEQGTAADREQAYPPEDHAIPFVPVTMKVVKDWYIKDTGDHCIYMSGRPIPVDADNITRDINFVDCELHPASNGDFENCQINGVLIPDGPGCLYIYKRFISDPEREASDVSEGSHLPPDKNFDEIADMDRVVAVNPMSPAQSRSLGLGEALLYLMVILILPAFRTFNIV